MDLGISGRVALVSGASKGMGRAIAEELSRNGVSVVMVARGKKALDEAVAGVTAVGGKAVGVQADMTVKADVMRAVGVATQTFGPPDIAVHNTNTIVPPKGRGFDNTADDEFREANEDYVMSAVFLARAVLPHMKAQRWGRKYYIHGGTKIVVDKLGLKVKLSIAVLGIASFSTLRRWARQKFLFEILESRYDPKLKSNFLTRAPLQLLMVLLNEWQVGSIGSTLNTFVFRPC